MCGDDILSLALDKKNKQDITAKPAQHMLMD